MQLLKSSPGATMSRDGRPSFLGEISNGKGLQRCFNAGANSGVGQLSLCFAAATGKGEAFLVTVINKAATQALHFMASSEKGMRQGRTPKLLCDLSPLLSGGRCGSSAFPWSRLQQGPGLVSGAVRPVILRYSVAGSLTLYSNSLSRLGSLVRAATKVVGLASSPLLGKAPG